jgi:hypothetical protein
MLLPLPLHRLRVREDKEMRRIFVCRMEITGGWKGVSNERVS